MIRGGKLRSFGEIVMILRKERLCGLGFYISVEGKLTAQQAIMLNRVDEDLHSTSDLAKADDIELQEITDIELQENAAKSTNNVIEQFEGTSSEMLPIRELQSLDNSSEALGVCLK